MCNLGLGLCRPRGEQFELFRSDVESQPPMLMSDLDTKWCSRPTLDWRKKKTCCAIIRSANACRIPALRRCDVPSYQTGFAITECQELPILQQQYIMAVRRLCDVFQVRAHGFSQDQQNQ